MPRANQLFGLLPMVKQNLAHFTGKKTEARRGETNKTGFSYLCTKVNYPRAPTGITIQSFVQVKRLDIPELS